MIQGVSTALINHSRQWCSGLQVKIRASMFQDLSFEPELLPPMPLPELAAPRGMLGAAACGAMLLAVAGAWGFGLASPARALVAQAAPPARAAAVAPAASHALAADDVAALQPSVLSAPASDDAAADALAVPAGPGR
jgi:hypothetical protein